LWKHEARSSRTAILDSLLYGRYGAP
jgi:hypothetical protein